MTRPIVLSNGRLHVGLNVYGLVHDFYFPHVGFENHSAGENTRHHIGVWVDGEISWFDLSTEWEFTFSYPYGALIGHIIAKNSRLGLILEFDDFVDSDLDAFIRNIHIVNLRDADREVRVFLRAAFAIGDSRSNSDTAQYLPGSDAILHYRGDRAFIISGLYNGMPFDQYSIGLFGIEGKAGTYKDAEDGELGSNSVEHGRVDSTIRFKIRLRANSSKRMFYWIAAGYSIRDALDVHRSIIDDGIPTFMHRTVEWWQKWTEPAYGIIEKIPPTHRTSFIQSLMIIKSQIDNNGAVIASTDTSLLNYSRDAYSYCWPRDAAYVLWPLIRMGFKHEAIKFFEFAKNAMHREGYLMHKYRADMALGSSWHSYLHENGVVTPPIQEDETALPLFIFAQYYKLNQDRKLLDEYYEPFVKPMANFLADFIDDTSGLPRATYDLWERVFETSTYTTSVVYAALLAASDLAITVGDQIDATKWRSVADSIQSAARKYLYDTERKVFYRGVNVVSGQIIPVDVLDTSSVFGAYSFGLFAPDSDEVTNSIRTLSEAFGFNNGALGLPRYENDDYRRASPGITGNYWFIASFWMAQYCIETGNLTKAQEILDWAKSHSINTGIMSEQIDPITHEIISPAPLTWTHAEYIATLLDLASKQQEISE